MHSGSRVRLALWQIQIARYLKGLMLFGRGSAKDGREYICGEQPTAPGTQWMQDRCRSRLLDVGRRAVTGSACRCSSAMATGTLQDLQPPLGDVANLAILVGVAGFEPYLESDCAVSVYWSLQASFPLRSSQEQRDFASGYGVCELAVCQHRHRRIGKPARRSRVSFPILMWRSKWHDLWDAAFGYERSQPPRLGAVPARRRAGPPTYSRSRPKATSKYAREGGLPVIEG